MGEYQALLLLYIISQFYSHFSVMIIRTKFQVSLFHPFVNHATPGDNLWKMFNQDIIWPSDTGETKVRQRNYLTQC